MHLILLLLLVILLIKSTVLMTVRLVILLNVFLRWRLLMKGGRCLLLFLRSRVIRTRSRGKRRRKPGPRVIMELPVVV